MDILMGVWTWIANNILTQPAYFIGVIVVLGYALLKKPWYDILAGFIKAVIGYQILAVGSSGLTNAFRPIRVGLQERFNMSAMVIDPYFGQNAVQAAVKEALKGNPPKVGTKKGGLTREQILKVENRVERQRLINENLDLFQNGGN